MTEPANIQPPSPNDRIASDSPESGRSVASRKQMVAGVAFMGTLLLFAGVGIYFFATSGKEPEDKRKNLSINAEGEATAMRGPGQVTEEARVLMSLATNLAYQTIEIGPIPMPLEQTAVFQNSGKVPNRISAISLAGSTEALTIEPIPEQCRPGMAVLPSNFCSIRVRWAPTGNATLVATLEMVHEGGRISIPITGTSRLAPAPQVQALPTQQVIDTTPRIIYVHPSRGDQSLALAAQRQARPMAISTTDPLDPNTPQGPLRSREPNWSRHGVEQNFSSLPVDMNRVITVGTYIPAVLETNIDTQTKAEVYAVTERPVFSRHGRNILIPGGSRVVGRLENQTSTSNKAERVAVIWTRIITPQGVSITIDAPSVDSTGRGGLPGFFDAREIEKYGNALLLTTFNALMTYQLAETTTQTTSTSLLGASPMVSQTQTLTPRQQAAKDLSDGLKTLGKEILEKGKELESRNLVPAGTRFNIQPTQDIWMRTPEALAPAYLEAQQGLTTQGGNLRNVRAGELPPAGWVPPQAGSRNTSPATPVSAPSTPQANIIVSPQQQQPQQQLGTIGNLPMPITPYQAYAADGRIITVDPSKPPPN